MKVVAYVLDEEKMGFDRFARRLFPSLSKLTYNPIFSNLVNIFDVPLSATIFADIKKLPPNNLRIRVGVGNKILNNQTKYLTEADSFWLAAALRGYFNKYSTIVDIGVGVGRSAHVLRDFNFCDDRFEGTYIGVDIDQEMISWCRQAFDAERFRFHHSTDSSQSYNQANGVGSPYSIPEPNGSVDFVFSRSLFTHLLEQELKNYLQESFRLLRPGGRALHSVFCLDHPPPTYGNRHTFSNAIGNAHVESLALPEAAVAYTEAFLIEAARAAGFCNPSLRAVNAGWHPVLDCER